MSALRADMPPRPEARKLETGNKKEARARGVVLPVVLLVIALLAVIGAMFAFHVHADVASLRAVEARLQTRLAAEAGVEYVKLMLRTSRLDRSRWYDNPQEFNRVLVWSDGTAPQDWGLNREWNDLGMAYRFSIVADDPTDDEEFARFGITDESSKLNLNRATADQLNVLVRMALAGDDSVDPQAIVNAILDWRDSDSDPSGEEGDTEGDYYKGLDRPYLVKNAPFDSVEELLLVKGVTERLLYGEDRDRNGLMTPNENDGDHLYPPDNLDGVLDRGMYPYLTVLSSEDNVANDNRARTYLYGPEVAVREALALALEDHGDWVDFVIQTIKARPKDGKAPKPTGGPGGKPPGQDGKDGAGSPGGGAGGPQDGGQKPPGGTDGGGEKPGGAAGTPGASQGGGGAGGKPPAGAPVDGGSPIVGGDASGAGGGASGAGGGKPPGGKPPGSKPPGSKPPKPPKPGGGSKSAVDQKSNIASAKLQHESGTPQQGGGGSGAAGGKPKTGGGGMKPPKGGDGGPSAGGGGGVPGGGGGGADAGDGSDGSGGGDEGGALGEGDQGGSDGEQPKDGSGQESGGEAGGTQPIRSPAAFFVGQNVDGVEKPSPIPTEFLAVMLDRFTAEPPETKKVVGLVNVNTAPRQVLRTLPVLSEQQIDAILEVRDGLSREASSTPAWLVTSGAVDINVFEKVAHLLTARGQQFMVESIGFGDHTGMVTRLQLIVDMVGPVAQTVYYRDLSQLGGRFPIREEDQKRSKRGR